MNFEDLKDPELQEKLKSAKTPEELVRLVVERGCELSDGQLETLAGGDAWYEPPTPCMNAGYCDTLGN